MLEPVNEPADMHMLGYRTMPVPPQHITLLTDRAFHAACPGFPTPELREHCRIVSVTDRELMARMAQCVDKSLEDMRRWATQMRRRSVTAFHYFLAAFPEHVLQATRPFDAMRDYCEAFINAPVLLGIAVRRDLARSAAPIMRVGPHAPPWRPAWVDGIAWLMKAMIRSDGAELCELGPSVDERDAELVLAGALIQRLAQEAAGRGYRAWRLTAPLVAADALERLLGLPAAWQLVALVTLGVPEDTEVTVSADVERAQNGAPWASSSSGCFQGGAADLTRLAGQQSGENGDEVWRVEAISESGMLAHARQRLVELLSPQERQALDQAPVLIAVCHGGARAERLTRAVAEGWVDPWATVAMLRRVLRGRREADAAPARRRGAVPRRRPSLGWWLRQLKRVQMVGRRLAPAPVDTYGHFVRCRPDLQVVGAVVQNVTLAAHEVGCGTLWLRPCARMHDEVGRLLGVEGPWRVGAVLAAGIDVGH